ncbi:MAG: hypothetical protein EXR75_12305 [Myxococcales bacterium]|nr:hypothetical protein [Myxococcales bacterium]
MKQHDTRANRRVFLGGATAALLLHACGSASETEREQQAQGASSGGGGTVGGGGGNAGGGGDPVPLECTPTADNLLGPYYRAGAPFRDDLTEPAMAGTRVSVRGRVFGPDCERLAGAVLDVWQADDTGGYDNDGVGDPADGAYVLRGKIVSDAEGHYAFRTIIPGNYLNGAQYRPAHIHVTTSADGYEPLTTQLYFESDPYNAIDPFIIDSLIMNLSEGVNGELEAAFDFVLAPVPG